MEHCLHNNLKYFKNKEKVTCLDCGDDWFKINTNRIDGETKEKILTLRERAYTFNEIGKILGISRQRVYQIYKTIK